MDAIELYAEPEEGLTLAGSQTLIDRYVDSLDVRPRSKESYRKGVTYFLRWMEREGVTRPMRADVIRYKQELLASKSVCTTASYLTAVRSFFGYLHAETGYPNIMEGVKNPKSREGQGKDALSVEQARDVMEAAMSEGDTLAQKRDFAIVTLLTHTGLRTIEAERANIEDLRSVAGVNVLDVWGKGRDKKDERVKITASVKAAIEDYLKAREQVEGKLRGEAPLFASVSHRNFGGRLTARSVSRICKQSLRAAGYDDRRLTAHSLRHTAVTTALKAGAPIRDVQQMARHKSPVTTERYAHDLRRLEDAAEDAIEAALAS